MKKLLLIMAMLMPVTQLTLCSQPESAQRLSVFVQGFSGYLRGKLERLYRQDKFTQNNIQDLFRELETSFSTRSDCPLKEGDFKQFNTAQFLEGQKDRIQQEIEQAKLRKERIEKDLIPQSAAMLASTVAGVFLGALADWNTGTKARVKDTFINFLTKWTSSFLTVGGVVGFFGGLSDAYYMKYTYFSRKEEELKATDAMIAQLKVMEHAA